MAVIDTFLNLMVAQKADRLILAPEEIPTVFKGDEASQLPMPVVPADLVERLALEVVGGTFTDDQPVEGTYRNDDGIEFAYVVIMTATGRRIEMCATGTEEPAAAPPGDTPSQEAPPQLAVTDAVPPPATALPDVAPVLQRTVETDASDLFLSSGKPPRMRVNGVIAPLDTGALTEAQILQLIPQDPCHHELDRTGSTDFAACWDLSGTSRRFRINVFRHSGGLAAALRPIRSRIPSLEELQLPGDLLELCSYPSGLVLLTGASGSGKSSTLAAMIDHLNRTKARHIITIEDPIEFAHRDEKSLVHQREVGSDVESFSTGLRAALRENPDVILLGEMRDLPTIAAALTAAETGHLVLSTLHTGSATAAVNRIIDVFPGHQQAHVRVQLASSLRAVVSQRLVRTADQAGRVPAIEKLIVNPAVANSIRDGHEHHMRSAMQTGAHDGMITLERSLAVLVGRGTITHGDAFLYADDQLALQKLLE